MGTIDTTALVVVDMLNRYEHEDAEPLKRSVRHVLPVIAGLVEQAEETGVVEADRALPAQQA